MLAYASGDDVASIVLTFESLIFESISSALGFCLLTGFCLVDERKRRTRNSGTPFCDGFTLKTVEACFVSLVALIPLIWGS